MGLFFRIRCGGRKLLREWPSSYVLLRVLRKGTSRQRAQVWLGLVLVIGTLVWVLFNLWELFLVMALFLLGVYLIGRSMRDSRPSSSS